MHQICLPKILARPTTPSSGWVENIVFDLKTLGFEKKN